MEIKLISEFIPENKFEKAIFFSYFLVFQDEMGNLELLPGDNHAASYPLVIDNNRKVTKGKVNFFNSPFYKGFTKDKLQDTDIKYYFRSIEHDKCLVINLLDNCYGHSLLKMFNTILFYKKYSEEYDFLIITPASLLAFLPKEKVNICCIDKTFRDLEQGYSLESVMFKIKEKYSAIDIAYLNTYQEYSGKEDQFLFFNFFIKPEKSGIKKHIIFYYRKDKSRRWGLFSQRTRITRYFNFFRPFFTDVDLILLGEKDNKKFPAFIQDHRCEQFSQETEFFYNAFLQESLFVTGIHGSHLILPSLLSRQVFHIVPKIKLRNTGEDVFNIIAGNIEGNYANFNIPVTKSYCYPGGSEIARLVLILFMASIEKEFKSNPENISRYGDQRAYIHTNYPSFRYEQAIHWWNRHESFILRSYRLLNR